MDDKHLANLAKSFAFCSMPWLNDTKNALRAVNLPDDYDPDTRFAVEDDGYTKEEVSDYRTMGTVYEIQQCFPGVIDNASAAIALFSCVHASFSMSRSS